MGIPNYSDYLPKRLKAGHGLRCCVLGDDGNRCRRRASYEDFVFAARGCAPVTALSLEPEWLVVYLCARCAHLRIKRNADQGDPGE